MKRFIPQPSRCRRSWLVSLGLLCAVSAAACAEADITPVAFTAHDAALAPLVACLTHELAGGGAVVAPDRLMEGLEFLITLQTGHGTARLITFTALLKPNSSALQAHDDDPEAQARAAALFYDLLRVHVGTRAWPWRGNLSKICREAAAWTAQMRSRPVLFDRIARGAPPSGAE